MDIFPLFPRFFDLFQKYIRIPWKWDPCARRTRDGIRGIQTGIFIYTIYKWYTSKCRSLSPSHSRDTREWWKLDRYDLDAILTRLHPLIGDQWETLSKINCCTVTSNARSKSVRRSPREISQEMEAQEWSKKAGDRGMPFDYASCVRNYDINLRRETLGGMEILISIGVGSGASRFICLDLYLDRTMYRATMWEQLRIEVLNG